MIKAGGNLFLGNSPSLLEYYKPWKMFLISLLHKTWDAFATHKEGTMTQMNRKDSETSAGWIPTSQKTTRPDTGVGTTQHPAISPFANSIRAPWGGLNKWK